jgi:UbiD family decarboxylase
LSSLLGFQEAFANRDVALVTVSIERLGWPAIDRTLKELDANALHVTIAGALHGAPLPVVNCITNEVRVPAEAEIVIEGRLLPHEREMESSFGELPQYYGEPAKCHVIEVTALTHRKNAIFHTIVGGGLEHLLLGGIPREATLGNSGRSRDGT